jgi:chromosome segregation ATPase
MENFKEQLPQHLQEEINLLVQEHAAEKKDLVNRLEQLGRSYQSLEQENESLLEQIGLGTADEDQKAMMENRWKEENIKLKDRLAEQEYLEDILTEKNAQIEFLQRQLEQRIKNYYQGEQQQAQQATELEKFKEREADILGQCNLLKTDISKREEEIRQLQTIVNENEDCLNQKDQLIESKNWLIDNLENQLTDARSQYETANNLLALKETALVELQQKLFLEKNRSSSLEEKLHSGRQTLRRLYDEYSSFLDIDADQSPVIKLRPGYSNRDGEEIASN